MSFFYWFITGFFRLIFLLFYRQKVYGIKNLPLGPALIASNHASFYDPPIISASSPEELHFLARASLFDIPILSFIIRKLNAHPVTGTASDLSSFKLICQLISIGNKVVIFPEGTRSKTGELIPIKPGIGMLAMRCNAPIIPTYIHGSYEAWPTERKFPKPWGKITVIFGEPIDWHNYSHLSKKEAQIAIANDVGLALTKLAKQATNS